MIKEIFMCFSAPASFTASILLLALARVAYQKTMHKSQFMLATTPLLFAMQQACEGVLWLTFTHPTIAAIKPIAMYSFLFFAFIVWPTWIPISAWAVEPTNEKSKIYYSLIALGIFLSTTLAAMLLYFQAEATIYLNHINYTINISPFLCTIGMISYLIAVITPLFISSIRSIQFFGFLLTASYLFSLFFYHTTFTSTWCFFVAALSSYIIIILDQMNKRNYANNK